jgi:hypothetical protein
MSDTPSVLPKPTNILPTMDAHPLSELPVPTDETIVTVAEQHNLPPAIVRSVYHTMINHIMYRQGVVSQRRH